MKFTPLNDRVLIRRLDSETTTAGGLVIPDVAKERPAKGTIEGLGAQILRGVDRQIAIGDTVLFSKYAGLEIKLDNVDYIVLREEEILGIVAE